MHKMQLYAAYTTQITTLQAWKAKKTVINKVSMLGSVINVVASTNVVEGMS